MQPRNLQTANISYVKGDITFLSSAEKSICYRRSGCRICLNKKTNIYQVPGYPGKGGLFNIKRHLKPKHQLILNFSHNENKCR